MKLESFVQYCWKFYAPWECYGHFFGDNLTIEETRAACLLVSKRDGFEGDSIDREIARDVILYARNPSSAAKAFLG